MLRSQRLHVPSLAGAMGRPSAAMIPRATPVAKIDEPFEGIDDDDEVCGIDFITMEPITGADCRRMRDEEARMRTKAAAVAEKASTAVNPVVKSFTEEDGYDFFGKLRPAKPSSSKPSPPITMPTLPTGAASLQPEQLENSEKVDLPSSTASISTAITAVPRRRGRSSSTKDDSIRPAFRSTPLFAEFMRQQEGSPTARILFLDEGGEFRASLGAALLRHMLSKLRTSLDVTVHCASLGPATGRGPPSPTLQRTAAAMGISLNAEIAPPEFDNVTDAVRYDLILVMDRFDYQEVLKEISILDTINPGGNYSGRVRTLGPFGMAARRATPSQVAIDISDPLYDTYCESESAQQEALQGIAQELAFACRGLATYLIDLQVRCGGIFTLREALAQSLFCPLLAGELPPERDRLGTRGPARDDNFVVVHETGGRRRVARRASRMKKKGYWKDAANVEKELQQWMQVYKLDRLPTQRELRAGYASSLASAIDMHGGLAEFSSRLRVPMASRRPNGYWADFTNLERALKAFLKPVEEPAEAWPLLPSSKEVQELVGGALRSSSTSKKKKKNTVMLMPSVHELTAAGRADLLRAIREHGGVLAVAEKLGVRVRRGAGWDEATLLQELRTVGAQGNIAVKSFPLPSRDQLLTAGRGDLVSAIDKLGGIEYFRALDCSTRSSSTSSGTARSSLTAAPVRKLPVIEEVSEELAEWMKALGVRGRVPTRVELEVSGRKDLWVAVQRCGGGRRVAEHMGLDWVETRGRRRKKEKREESLRGGSMMGVDAAEEIRILDAYEEFVFV